MSELRAKYNMLQGELNLVSTQIKEKTERRKGLSREQKVLETSKWVVTEASRISQELFTETVESLVTIAIQSVFDRPFEFKLITERKRGKIEQKPIILEGENEYIPKDEMGGGIIDIISFAFRVVLWSLEKPRRRNLLVLDEPFKFTGSLITRAGQMVKELSSELGIQIILITHEEALKEIADISYSVTHDGTKSKVKSLQGPKQRRASGGNAGAQAHEEQPPVIIKKKRRKKKK